MPFFGTVPRARVRVIHDEPCGPCPSHHGNISGEHDPESLDLLAADRQTQLNATFACGWRPEKVCRGLCDFLSISQADLDAATLEE